MEPLTAEDQRESPRDRATRRPAFPDAEGSHRDRRIGNNLLEMATGHPVTITTRVQVVAADPGQRPRLRLNLVTRSTTALWAEGQRDGEVLIYAVSHPAPAAAPSSGRTHAGRYPHRQDPLPPPDRVAPGDHRCRVIQAGTDSHGRSTSTGLSRCSPGNTDHPPRRAADRHRGGLPCTSFADESGCWSTPVGSITLLA